MSGKQSYTAQDDGSFQPGGSESEQDQRDSKTQQDTRASACLAGQDPVQEPTSSRLATPKSVKSSASKKGKKSKKAQDGEQQQSEAESEQQQEQPEQQPQPADDSTLRQILRALGFQAQPGQLSSGFSVRSGATPPPGYHQTGEQSEPQHILQRADEHPARKLWDQAAPPIKALPAVEEKVGDDEDEDDEE